MRKNILTIMCVMMLGFLFVIQAQELKMSESHSALEGLNCTFCHECLQPSKEDPCLKLDPKIFIGEGSVLTKYDMPPDTIVLDKLEEQYSPVKYPHRQHVHMAEKSGYCVDCHHFLPPGMEKQPCSECHKEEVPWKENSVAVGLSGAYHRKCMTCHVEWSKSTSCEVCHEAKDPEIAAQSAPKPEFREVKEPEEKVLYFTRYFTGPFVNFSHPDHTKRKNVLCVDCHNASPCISCHYQGEKPTTVAVVKGEGVHKSCSSCHETIASKNCVECHKTVEQQKKLSLTK